MLERIEKLLASEYVVIFILVQIGLIGLTFELIKEVVGCYPN